MIDKKEGIKPSVVSITSSISHNFDNSKRTRNWLTILYPESADPNWKNILSESGVKCIVSPLHDKDINPTGEPKKPHYHIMFMFNGVKSITQVMALTTKLGATIPQVCQDAIGSARYFIHKDNPEKYQYSGKDVLNFGGADWSEMIMTASDKFQAIHEVEKYITDNHLILYHEVSSKLYNENFELYKVYVRNTIHFKAFLLSLDYEAKRQENIYFKSAGKDIYGI